MPEMRLLKHKDTGAVYAWTPALALNSSLVEASQEDVETFRNKRRQDYQQRLSGNIDEDEVAELRETIVADGERNSSPERQTEYAIAQELAIKEKAVPSQRFLERETARQFIQKDQSLRSEKRNQPAPEPLVEGDPQQVTRDARRAEQLPSQPTLTQASGGSTAPSRPRPAQPSPQEGQRRPTPPTEPRRS